MWPTSELDESLVVRFQEDHQPGKPKHNKETAGHEELQFAFDSLARAAHVAQDAKESPLDEDSSPLDAALVPKSSVLSPFQLT